MGTRCFLIGKVVIPLSSDPLTRGNVIHFGICPKPLQQSKCIGIFFQCIHGMLGVVQIPECNGTGGAGLGAGGLVSVLFDLTPTLYISPIFGSLIAVKAKTAFFDRAAKQAVITVFPVPPLPLMIVSCFILINLLFFRTVE